LTADEPDLLEAFSDKDRTALIDRALGLLPPEVRQIVEMNYLLEMSHAEMALHLGLSDGALDVRLHRARRRLYEILHGQLHHEAEALGLQLNQALIEGWQSTRLWCPLCGRRRLEGCFVGNEGSNPNLHLRCPACSSRYQQDTVHSMGLVNLSGVRSFRPAWKRTMQGLTDQLTNGLQCGQYPCACCGQPALLSVEGNEQIRPYSFWLRVRCIHCGNDLGIGGNLPSVDQLVYWSHPRTRQFLMQHERWLSEPGKLVEYSGQAALCFQISDLENSERLVVLADRQTLRVLTIS